ncbi:MAG: nitroreductase family protein [Acidimicrobiales bacterium]
MDLSSIINSRRMVRSFSERPLPAGMTTKLASYARAAPSAGNTSGWKAIILEDPYALSSFWKATTDPGWRSRSKRWNGLSRAPAAIVMLTDPKQYTDRYSLPGKVSSGLGTPPNGGGEGAWPIPYWFVDAGFAAMLIMLGATEAGIGSLFLGNFRGESELKELLGIPEPWRHVGTILLGYPDGKDYPSSSIKYRPHTEDTICYGRWDATEP